jgi:hypothetical protein
MKTNFWEIIPGLFTFGSGVLVVLEVISKAIGIVAAIFGIAAVIYQVRVTRRREKREIEFLSRSGETGLKEINKLRDNSDLITSDEE